MTQEKCDSLDSLIQIASLSGGAGGGITDGIVERINVDIPKHSNVMLGVFPSNNSGQSIVQDYNCVLSAMGIKEHVDLMVIL